MLRSKRLNELGIKAVHRAVERCGTSVLRKPSEAYAGEYAGENDVLALENTVRWEENTESAET